MTDRAQYHLSVSRHEDEVPQSPQYTLPETLPLTFPLTPPQNHLEVWSGTSLSAYLIILFAISFLWCDPHHPSPQHLDLADYSFMFHNTFLRAIPHQNSCIHSYHTHSWIKPLKYRGTVITIHVVNWKSLFKKAYRHHTMDLFESPEH